jgi:hypothetical protein
MAHEPAAPRAGALDPKDLLLADLQLFESTMARNEETGEKRFSFLISLLTAVGGGLGALYTADDVDTARVTDVAAGASVVLAVFALLTYLRLLHRNRVTDEHKDTLKHIRDTYRGLCPELAALGYSVPTTRDDKSWRSVFRGGYAETAGVVTGALVGAGLRLAVGLSVAVALALAVAVAAALVLVAAAQRSATGTGSATRPRRRPLRARRGDGAGPIRRA